MNRKREGFIFRALGLVFLVILGPLLLHASHEARRQTVCVSIPNLQIGDKERVVGFEIHVGSGRIAALPDIPIGWNVSIDNDPSWNTKIEGSLKVGAAAVPPRLLSRIPIY
jgi:hypothetical protein